MAEGLVPVSALASLQAEVRRLSRASERAGGTPLVLTHAPCGRSLARVRISAETVTLAGWEIVAVLHHDTNGTPVEPCAPLPRSQLERLKEARALCEACRTVRPRKQTWVLRERSDGRTVQVGSSCMKPFTGAASVERALVRAKALAGAHAALAAAAVSAKRAQPGPGDQYIDTTAFLAGAVAAVRAHGFAAAREPDPSWRRALALLEAGADPAAGDVQRALEIRAWARTTADEGSEYRGRLAACLGRERLSSRELPLAASAVRGYNRWLYREIRRRKAHALRRPADPVRPDSPGTNRTKTM